MEKPIKQGSSKCPIYLRMQCLWKEATAIKKNVKNTVNSIFKFVQLRISHFIRKPLNGIYMDFTVDLEKTKVIYKFKCHCDSVYIGRTSQRFILEEINMFQNPSEVG